MSEDTQKNDLNSLVIPRTTESKVPSTLHWGIDAAKVSFPINGELSLPLDDSWEQKTGRKTKTSLPNHYFFRDMQFGLGKMKVLVWELSQTCIIDFNPAHALYGATADLLPPELYSEMVKRAIEATMLVPAFAECDDQGEFTFAENWPNLVSNKELEVSFNFEVDDYLAGSMQSLLSALPSRKGSLRSLKEKSGSFTISHETRNVGKDMIYNKSSEMASRKLEVATTPGKTLYRFESKLMTKRIHSTGMRKVADVSGVAVWNAITKRYRASGWGVKVASQAEIFTKLGSLDYRHVERLLGFNEAFRLGIAGGIKQSVQKSRIRELKEVGLPLGTSLEELTPHSMWIDAWNGLLMTDGNP